jgi:hypothetical protein
VDIEDIRRKVAEGRYSISFTHTEKLRLRRIKAADIEQAVKSGNVIEDYTYDPRGASCLILGRIGDRPLHILFARLEAEEILVVTAYEPDPEEWEDDWQTRKAR